MPCTMCGMEGHNAKSCIRGAVSAKSGGDQIAAGVTAASEKKQVSVVGSDGTPAAKKQRIDSECAGRVASPVLVPKDDDVDVDVVKVMAGIVEAVTEGLPALLLEFGIVSSALPLCEYPPLDIKSEGKKGGVSSYKEPWRKSRAVMSIASVSMYEGREPLLVPT